MDAIRRHPLLTLIGVLLVIWLAWILLGAVTHDTTTTGTAEAADPAEQAGTDAPGVTEVKTTGPIDRKGRYLTIVRGQRDLGMRERGGEWSDGGVTGQALYGKAGCKVAWEEITLNSFIGTDLAKTKHNLRFCYDGKRVFDVNASRNCDVLSPGALAQWHANPKQTRGWWARWNGYDHGTWHSWLRCEYWQGVVWQANIRQHYSEIVGGATGFVNWP